MRGGEIDRISGNSFNEIKSPCLGVSTQENLLEDEGLFLSFKG